MRPRGKWSDAGTPHKGWTCVGFEDLGEPRQTCAMCEQQEIRYVHLMAHSDYPGTIAAGRECAANMEAVYEAAHARERRHKARAGRRLRWLTRAWRESRKGHPYLNVDGFNVVVFPAGGGWGFRVQERVDDMPYVPVLFFGSREPPPQASPREVSSRRCYATVDAAKLAAFDALALVTDE